MHVAVQFTFISSRFGGRDTGLVPPSGTELRQVWTKCLEKSKGAPAGRGGEEEVCIDLEEEDGC